jgi:2',3'-cyclic-nucleotide 2'-phosphodiesterase (5'-nucleotidase family)
MKMRRLNTAFSFILIVFLFIPSVYGEPLDIRILHVNDFHGFVEPYKPIGSDELLGGITYLSNRVEELRKEKPSLLLSAGDMIQGHNWANLFKGESVIELMNAMGFDAMVVGNHEFDFGQETLRERISEAKFPILGANLERVSGLKPYVLKDLSGVRIAIIGLVTEDVPAITHPRNVEGLKFSSSIETAERFVKELREKVDLLIILSHMGYPVDRMLAEKVEGIDVIVGGHTHTKISQPVYVKNTVIVQAWENGKALGILDLTIKDRKIIGYRGHLEEIKPEMGKENQTIQEIVKKYNQKMDAVLDQKIGETEVDLDGERRNVRRKETNFGNLIADIVRQASGADMAIINGGGIRASIRNGEIRVKDIYTALPFDNYTVAVRITGKQIKEALEHGVSTAEEEEGRFPQVSGLTFTYSLSGTRGSRTREIWVGGKPIDPNQEYTVATNDFLAVGGDGYKVFAEPLRMSGDYSILGGAMKGEKIIYSDPGRWLRDVVVEYIKEKRKVAPKVEGRIKEID